MVNVLIDVAVGFPIGRFPGRLPLVGTVDPVSVLRLLSVWSTVYCHGYCFVLIYWSPVGAHLLTAQRFIGGSVLVFGRVWRSWTWVSFVLFVCGGFIFCIILLWRRISASSGPAGIRT